MNIVIGNRIGGSKGQSWSSYWSSISRTEVLFFGEISKITGGRLYNQKSGATDYLTVGGSAGSYTFQCPNTAAYKSADASDTGVADYIWFKTDETQRTVTEAELIGYDFTRTIVKYEDVSDYSIQAIMILSSNVDTAKMRNDFHLSIWWSNVLSLYGYTKGNRSAEKSVWTPEVVAIVDADGNEYTEVVIGTQTWLVEPLRTTKYNDGSAIPNLTVNGDWAADTTGAYCWFNNDIANKERGALYNWYAGNTDKLHITGYHIPSATEFNTLNTYLNGISAGTQGGQMKSTGTTEWASPNTGATNSSGFTGRPAAYRTELGAFGANQSQNLGMWVKEQVSATNANIYYLTYNNDDLLIFSSLKKFGREVRLIKD